MAVKIKTRGWNGESLTLKITHDGEHDNLKVESKGSTAYALHLGKDSITIHSWSEKKPGFVAVNFGEDVTVEEKRVFTVKDEG